MEWELPGQMELIQDCPKVDMIVSINTKTLKEKGYAFRCYECGNGTKLFKTEESLRESEAEWIAE